MEDREVSILASADFTKKIPNKIRLYYVSLEQFKRYGTNDSKIGQSFNVSSPFKIPHGVRLEDACKIVSYLSEKVEKERNIEPASSRSVARVSEILTDYGFERLPDYDHGYTHSVVDCSIFGSPLRKISKVAPEPIEGVVDLFTVGGDLKLFENSELFDRYFDWFSPNVTEKDVMDIYNLAGMRMCDVVTPKHIKEMLSCEDKGEETITTQIFDDIEKQI